MMGPEALWHCVAVICLDGLQVHQLIQQGSRFACVTVWQHILGACKFDTIWSTDTIQHHKVIDNLSAQMMVCVKA